MAAQSFPGDLALYAKHAKSHWGFATVETTQGTLPLAAVHLAIWGAESGGTWDRQTRGDTAEDLAAWPQTAQSVRDCNCLGYGSWAAPQIFLPAHKEWLRAQTRIDSPCRWAEWLCDVPNGVSAAKAIFESQGLGAWSTYKGGEWVGHLAVALKALKAAS